VIRGIKERQARKDASRPCLSPDEINQYINQAVNDIREHPWAVKVEPSGEGATEDSAAARGGIIRNIDYKSKAQGAYATAFENAVSRSYGFWMISTRYTNEQGWEQEPYIRRIPNPDTVLIDPDTKEADHSDMADAFVEDIIPVSTFKSRYKGAKIQDFAGMDVVKDAGTWLQAKDRVRIAEYWKVDTAPTSFFCSKMARVSRNRGSSRGLPLRAAP
jgi:hypothetical protein